MVSRLFSRFVQFPFCSLSQDDKALRMNMLKSVHVSLNPLKWCELNGSKAGETSADFAKDYLKVTDLPDALAKLLENLEELISYARDED